MKLNRDSITNIHVWKQAGIELPGFDIDVMTINTFENPTWVHFGAGNIFRGFIAMLQQKLLNEKKDNTGIIAVGTYDPEIIDKIYKPYDNLSLLCIMNSDGSLEKKVVGSVAESLVGDVSRKEEWQRLKEIFSKPSLQMVSFTITEKGYSLTGMDCEYYQDILSDFENGPDGPMHIMAKVASLAYTRYCAGKLPIAYVSMDNCSRNGEILRNSIIKTALNWLEKGYVDSGFLEYLEDKSKVSFPWTMIDKITPRPSLNVQSVLNSVGFESTEIICTQKNTYVAPFVNAEKAQYLVIEDEFPNGRMPLEAAGVLFTDRDTVGKVEKMKVTTCLNPLHTALAVFGCLLGFTSIADEMKDGHLKKLVEKIGFEEGMPVVVNPGILRPEDFIREVIQERLPNPYIPDTPQRIASDTSQKVGIRFGETINTYVSNPNMDASSLKYIPLVIAGWCRYLLGMDDRGEIMALSPDPMLEQLTANFVNIKLGKQDSVHQCLKPILSNKKIFGLSLYDVGLGEKTEGYFLEMISGKNAVRNTLAKYLG